jgi:hypothetical protein
MGELAELIEKQGFKSLRALAKQIARRFPEVNVETLANKVRDLDKGKDRSWWSRAGKRFRAPLAEALDVDMDELWERLESDEGMPKKWRFDQLPLRPLDYEHEELFPGIPSELSQRRGPASKLTWWHAAPGAGKSLVGRWLQVRYGWAVLSAATWEDLEERLPNDGDVFVILEHGGTSTPSKGRSGRLCVACPGLPSVPPRQHEQRAAQPEEWTLVAAPPAKAWLHSLIDWVADRIDEGGGFNRREIYKLVEEINLEDWIATPGDLFGFLGVVEKIGIRKLREALTLSTTPLSLVREWWKLQLERKDRDEVVKKESGLRNVGVEQLIKAEERRLRRGLPSTLSLSSWEQLFDEQPSPPIERARLREILKRPDGQTEMQRILDEESPSRLSGFRTLGIFHEEQDGRWALRPSWIARILRLVAIDSLKRDTESLGALLLHPETAEEVVADLLHEIRDGRDEQIRRCLEPGAAHPSAEELAAINGAFIALGLAVAEDKDVPLDLVVEAWRRQSRHLASRYKNWSLTTPILSVSAPRGDRGIAAQGTWLLAVVAILNRLAEHGIEEKTDGPWDVLLAAAAQETKPAPSPLLAIALGQAATALGYEDEVNGDVGQLLYLLGERLLRRVGFVADGDRVARAQQPARLIQLFQGIVEVSPKEREDLLYLPWGLDVLEKSCRRLGASYEDLLRWCWQTWGHLPERRWPPMRSWGETFDQGRLWNLAPASALTPKTLERLKDWPWAWPHLGEEVWNAWLAACNPGHPSQKGLQMLAAAPAAVALALVRQGSVHAADHEVWKILWDRIPSELIGLIAELAASPSAPSGDPLVELVFSTPARHVEAMLLHAEQWRSHPAGYPAVTDWLERWLLSVIEHRLPGWRGALAMVTGGAPRVSLPVPPA